MRTSFLLFFFFLSFFFLFMKFNFFFGIPPSSKHTPFRQSLKRTFPFWHPHIAAFPPRLSHCMVTASLLQAQTPYLSHPQVSFQTSYAKKKRKDRKKERRKGGREKKKEKRLDDLQSYDPATDRRNRCSSCPITTQVSKPKEKKHSPKRREKFIDRRKSPGCQP